MTAIIYRRFGRSLQALDGLGTEPGCALHVTFKLHASLQYTVSYSVASSSPAPPEGKLERLAAEVFPDHLVCDDTYKSRA
ncbi:hypothetical protein CIB48_g7322 [Xylaria polymorpha]|nr:hypothetical protein CIB48_g7322 [Xylaria polymorpha]